MRGRAPAGGHTGALELRIDYFGDALKVHIWYSFC
jgi:hypothetical protein